MGLRFLQFLHIRAGISQSTLMVDHDSSQPEGSPAEAIGIGASNTSIATMAIIVRMLHDKFAGKTSKQYLVPASGRMLTLCIQWFIDNFVAIVEELEIRTWDQFQQNLSRLMWVTPISDPPARIMWTDIQVRRISLGYITSINEIPSTRDDNDSGTSHLGIWANAASAFSPGYPELNFGG